MKRRKTEKQKERKERKEGRKKNGIEIVKATQLRRGEDVWYAEMKT
jgi:hypothetical protein